MLEMMKNEANLTYTENGAVTHRSAGSDCLDFFATAGALRSAADSEIISRFISAFAEDRDIAMRILFFARDVRGGLGERRVFRVILAYLANNYPETVKKNIPLIAEYGRYDDLLSLLGTPCESDALSFIRSALSADITALDEGREVTLLGKWLPSINASDSRTIANAQKIAKFCCLSYKEYRQALVRLRAKIKIIENNLREMDYSFDYSKQPSKAMLKYRAAFIRNDGDRYREFLSSVERGETKLNTGALMPYEIIRSVFNYGIRDASQRRALDVTWNNLPDYGSDENAIAVVDGSGSMYGCGSPSPITVAMSLGIYFAERNRGAFHNHFITFSETPRLVEIKGKDITEKVQYCAGYNEVANTNISAVFDLILNTAVKNKLPQSELPSAIYIISDMEFDYCAEDADVSNFANAKAKFEAHGYRLPRVIFWNVESRNRQQPVTMHESGTALVSGCTPKLFEMVASGECDPYSFMLSVINSDRYAKISA